MFFSDTFFVSLFNNSIIVFLVYWFTLPTLFFLFVSLFNNSIIVLLMYWFTLPTMAPINEFDLDFLLLLMFQKLFHLCNFVEMVYAIVLRTSKWARIQVFMRIGWNLAEKFEIWSYLNLPAIVDLPDFSHKKVYAVVFRTTNCARIQNFHENWLKFSRKIGNSKLPEFTWNSGFSWIS